MNFKKLQTMQAKLDEAILQAKPSMTAEERFTKTLVALSVELAEVANCAEHFKFWKDKKGKIDSSKFRKHNETSDFPGMYMTRNHELKGLTLEQAHRLTLVEECSDCLHFILSLANQVGTEIGGFNLVEINPNLEYIYSELQLDINSLGLIKLSDNRTSILMNVIDKFYCYISELGVTTEELEQAYYEKNKVNYERLESGY